MASACLNRIGISPENLLECSQKYSSSYNWFSHRLSTESKMKNKLSSPPKNLSDPSEKPDLAKEVSDLTEEQDPTDFDGFEFRLDGSVMMLPADELFSDGKLVPLQLSVIHNDEPATSSSATTTTTVRSPDTPCSRRRSTDDAFSAAGDPYLFSPRAPRCTSRWKELLGFRKVTGANATGNGCNNTSSTDNNSKRSLISSSHNNSSSRSSIRQLLQRSNKSAAYDSSTINFPLLKEADTTESVSVSVSSRHSLSSSSSGHDLDDLPRLSLDSDKQPGKINLNLNPNTRPKTRMVKTNSTTEARNYTSRVSRNSIRRSSETAAAAAAAAAATNRGGVSIDSPRMNSSGKIVFHSLERSSSSPSSFNGGPRYKHKGMERSYSANVRITPVLNVPVCSKSGSMFGFPIFSSQQKQQREGCGSSNNGGLSNRSQKFNGNNR